MQAHSGLQHHDTVPEGILHPGSRTLFSYWKQLRGERSAPRRQDIELRAIASILPWVGVIERHGPEARHRWRLAGTGIARLWGNGLTGSEVAAGWANIYRCSLLRALDGVCERQQPFVARLKAVSECGEAVGLEFFAAPVQASDGASIQALCIVLPFNEPSWLGRAGVVDVELSTIIAIWTDPLPDELKDWRSRSPQPVQLKLIQGGRAD